VLASFINILSNTRKVSIDDVVQAFWAKKQCEIGIGLDIISESGVIVDRNTFVEGRRYEGIEESVWSGYLWPHLLLFSFLSHV
jgi:hypothetical protein